MPARTDLNARVVVDMTPLEPGGQNGGAGLVATSLVRHLSRLAPGLDFTLLTSSSSHDELVSLDAPNVRRRCVVQRRSRTGLARSILNTVVPARAQTRLKQAYWQMHSGRRYAVAAQGFAADLLFCPFTVPYFWRPGTPCIAIVHDLQHVTYPNFFTREQCLNRQRQVLDACARSDRVVCVSDYVRNSLLASAPVPSERVSTVHLGILQEAVEPDASILRRLDVNTDRFLLYPANFWPHKNHLRLFDALREYRRSRGSRLRLVLTGAPSERMRELQSTVADDPAFVFAGYVTTAELAALQEACAALVFPSLYEGFGMPVLEALARGRPVVCSRVTSLPEVAGDAAIYCNPSETSDIARAIAAAVDDPHGVTELVARGRARARLFGGPPRMAEDYLALIGKVLSGLDGEPSAHA